ncbi:zonular occludens toxin domain-containing protein [Acinetobacter colistiniresistens]|uniref:zonular occludens toxin domain-containing protein n=1 Tax=Acinetobacter colistiniresistens TaxID=280145 RepID=UPI000DD047CA|nr:zonular occludens toxin domain-containing protein [Acinetobacter colistiniresistens]
MLNAVTGVPGASKTAYVVTQLYDQERKNKINLVKNIAIHAHNKPFFEKFKDDFSYVEIEVGSGHELKTVLEILPDNYFDMLGQEFDDLRPDDYYVRVVRCNEIIERINDRGEKHDLQYFQAVRTIYTNIKALKIDYVRALVIDWRTCPDGSIIVIDEVQLVPPYNENKNKTDDIVQELTIHRHRGFDFWFITQSASYLHPTIKELISCHLHITRPYWRTPKVYQYGSLRQYPNTLINKLNCESKFDFKPKDFIFKLYKSTSIDTSKKRTPAGLYGFAAFIVLAICVFFYGLSGGSGFLGHFFGSDEKKIEVKKQTSTSQTSNVPTSDPNFKTNFDANTECRKAINVEKPECVKWFDTFKTDKQDNATVSYDPEQPYLTQSNLTYNVTSKPLFSGCAKFNGKYYAYTQQGTRLDVSSEDCKRLIEDGDRPFNYFATQQPVTKTPNTSNTELSQPIQDSL